MIPLPPPTGPPVLPHERELAAQWEAVEARVFELRAIVEARCGPCGDERRELHLRALLEVYERAFADLTRLARETALARRARDL